jgi:TonB family protein
MTRVSPLFGFMPYGAPELLDAGRPNMARALVVASTAGALAFALLGLLRLAHPGIVTIPRAPVVEIFDFPKPDAPTLTPLVDHAYVPPAAPPQGGSTIDEIIPDELVKVNSTAFVAPDMDSGTGPPTEVTGGEIVLDRGAPVETLPVRGTFAYVEVMPEALREVEPIYPTMPQELGISGLVLVHMLVGRDGRVVNAVVDEQKNDPMFNDASLIAARKWVFRPGSTNGRAVAVWVTVPFKYTFLSH